MRNKRLVILHLMMLFKYIIDVETVRIDMKNNIIQSRQQSLIHYWSFNSHVQDLIGGAHFFKGFQVGLTKDRFNRPFSALNFNTGFYQIPSINYFPNSQFTITSWVYLRQYNSWSRLFEFCTDYQLESIGYSFWSTNNQQNSTLFLYDSQKTSTFLTGLQIQLNTWTHIAITYGNNDFMVYHNSNIVNKFTTAGSPIINKAKLYNYIGKSCNSANPNLDGILDEFKIFDKSLNQQEIKHEMIY